MFSSGGSCPLLAFVGKKDSRKQWEQQMSQVSEEKQDKGG